MHIKFLTNFCQISSHIISMDTPTTIIKELKGKIREDDDEGVFETICMFRTEERRSHL